MGGTTCWLSVHVLLGLVFAVAAGLAPGKYSFFLKNERTMCGSYQGFLSAPGCEIGGVLGIWNAEMNNGLQHWTILPVGGGETAEGVNVRLQVGGRDACNAAFATALGSCSGSVRLKPRLKGSQALRQQWVLEVQPEGTYAIRSAACPSKYLAFRATCTTSTSVLTEGGKGATKYALSPVAPPEDAAPEGSSVTVVAIKATDWGSGYDGIMTITNNNFFPITNWKLSFTLEGGELTWQNDFIVQRSGSTYTCSPQEWRKVLNPGDALEARFGAKGPRLPSNVSFAQLAPPPYLDQTKDPLKERGDFPEQFFSPYTDALAWPTPQFQEIFEATGQLFFTLAFVQAKGRKPAWGGIVDIEEKYLADQIRTLRLQHGDVILSFGGCNGIELAEAIDNVQELAAAYQLVIDTYGFRWLDFDIEGGSQMDMPSVNRRNQAIKILQDKNPGLIISYCLPVLPAGLTDAGLGILKSALKYGVRVDVVQVMAMDYGDSAAPEPEGKMGLYAIQAAENTYRQTQEIGMDAKVGLIPMIGVNDVETEVFRLADACQMAVWATTKPWMRTLAFWSINRDQFQGFVGASPGSSGIEQEKYAFTNLLHKLPKTPAACGLPKATTAGISQVAALPPPPPIPDNATLVWELLPRPGFAHSWEGTPRFT